MFFFFFNDTATTEIYTLSLHDALPISSRGVHLTEEVRRRLVRILRTSVFVAITVAAIAVRSEEHTSELQSQFHLVCRLLLEKKKQSRRIRSRSTRASQQAATSPRP